jgi:hypothetical protein
MSHFYATMQGNRGQGSRCGTKASGLVTYTASWEGAVKVVLEEHDGVDYATVKLVPWYGEGTEQVLYRGPVSGKADVETLRSA